MRSWETANHFLRHGKNTCSRPLRYATRLLRCGNGHIVIKHHDSYTVKYLVSGGLVLVTLAGWNTVTTKARIRDHSPVSVSSYRVKGETVPAIYHESDPISPPRVWKCRRCNGGYVPSHCFGPRWCYSWGGTCPHGESKNHKLAECPHGRSHGHDLEPRKCWQCNGTGRYDYGSNPIPTMFGEYDVVVVRQDGKVLGMNHTMGVTLHPAVQMASTYKVLYHGAPVPISSMIPSAPNPGKVDNQTVTSALNGALKDLNRHMSCPVAPCSTMPMSLQGMIIHLNDEHHWARERIADWLETLDFDLTFRPKEEVTT